MKRTTLSLFGAVAALAAATGLAVVAAPAGGEGTTPAKAASRQPVQRSAALCPAPTSSDVGETVYTAFTPPTTGASGGKAAADLLAAAPGKKDDAVTEAAEEAGKDAGKAGAKKDGKDGKSKSDGKGATAPGTSVLAPKEPGKPATAGTGRSDAPALIGAAEGALAPGWTVQQSTVVSAGSGRGLHGLTCTAPDTSFWFPGVSTAKGRQDYVHLTNPDTTAAVVDLELYGKDGRIRSAAGEGVTLPPRSTVPVLLSTLADAPAESATLHVAARSGRVGAAVQASDEKLGGDWLPASAEPAADAVLPGIPADATSVRLIAFAPGTDDADLRLRFAGPSGSITPAGHETLHVKSGMTEAVDLGDVAKGETGSLLLTAEGAKSPVVAALRVTRGKDDKQETAFIPATAPVERRGTVADNRAKGSALTLVAPGKEAAEVKVTSSAGSEGGTAVSKTYTVKPGTTLAVEPPQPSGLKGTYAVTVEKVSGGPVHVSRTLSLPKDGVPMFTVQPVPDDRSTVAVPAVGQDLSMLNR
ncbi:DUF5719 family protein [Streptomyces albireticuli]|uniref:Secreted protein n=1 Tax=Streptomyces albireticuli TaxID=1940 RepID=A0A2A2D393_9ACTN|nr:DUF5719 family protein [Streptomyces albireticuli]MCD9144611.1 DUF5719 family protein [Streptomyces albireticuli]MCD9163326.1 DUF5719 family protein [Streptomyces albireticuli]MCD9193289.1 DUF5719 family protein [Streptomyces albireticuli]PAU45985.1 hypothetical protein CK936_26555 [Streptomyces albireticuli]